VSVYDYKETRGYWNAVFEAAPKFTVDTKIPYTEIVDGLKWLGENSKHVLDFGCGTGKALVVSAKYGVRSGLGIDLSDNAIELANQVVTGSKLEGEFEFKQGSIEALKNLEDASFDGAILFNILDNLHPEDGQELISELSRVLKKGASLLLKLNPVYEEEVFEEDQEFKKVAPSCYQEEAGVLFWNMDDEIINSLMQDHFEYENGYDVEMEDFDTVNRMYWLKKI